MYIYKLEDVYLYTCVSYKCSHLHCTLDRIIILGNHRDAWVFGGVDPNSATAVLMELARALSELRSNGETP